MTRLSLTVAALIALTAPALAAPDRTPLTHTLAGADAAVQHAHAAVARIQPKRPSRDTLAGADRAVDQARAAVRRLRPVDQLAAR